MKTIKFLKNAGKHQKPWYGKWHVYLGLLAGGFIFLMSLTGSILVFRYEIDKYLNPGIFNISERGEKLSPGRIIQMVENEHQDWKITLLDAADRPGEWPYVLLRNNSEDYIYVNPYTGKITGVRDYHTCFIGIVEHLHRYLLWEDKGKYITGIASLMLAILLITGLRLWIPKKIKNLKSRLSIKFAGSKKRINWDLHNTMGFYFSPPILLISLTGFIITFAKYVIPLFLLLSFEKPKSLDKILKQESVYHPGANVISVDEAINSALRLFPNGKFARVTMPKDSAGVYTLRIINQNELKTGDMIQLAVDQYSGNVIFNSDRDVPELTKIYTSWVGPLHFGTIGGLPTQILNLVASLITASLVITGFIIWLGRKKPKKSKKSKSEKILQEL